LDWTGLIGFVIENNENVDQPEPVFNRL